MKNKSQRPIAHVGLCALMLAGTALVGSASAQSRWNGDAITVYVNPNFNGPSMTLRGDTPDLVQLGINDKISSIAIPDGEAWEVCQDVNYEAQCQVLSGSVPDLRSMGWNDRISSLRRVNGALGADRYGGPVGTAGVQQGLVFYNRTNYKGASRVVTAATSNMGFSGQTRSVRLRGGGPWQVCDDAGQCATVNQDVNDLFALGLNGRITAVRPLSNRNNGRIRYNR